MTIFFTKTEKYYVKDTTITLITYALKITINAPYNLLYYKIMNVTIHITHTIYTMLYEAFIKINSIKRLSLFLAKLSI